MTPDEINAKIEHYQTYIEGLISEIQDAGIAAAEAETNYEIAYAQSRLSTRYHASESGTRVTVDAVDDEATVTTAELRRQALLTKNRLMTLREALSAAKSNLESLRTLSASSRIIL